MVHPLMDGNSCSDISIILQMINTKLFPWTVAYITTVTIDLNINICCWNVCCFMVGFRWLVTLFLLITQMHSCDKVPIRSIHHFREYGYILLMTKAFPAKTECAERHTEHRFFALWTSHQRTVGCKYMSEVIKVESWHVLNTTLVFLFRLLRRYFE